MSLVQQLNNNGFEFKDAVKQANEYVYDKNGNLTQGNNRVVISSTGTVEETNHYYPFGGVFAATNNVQPYKYNGKEFDSKNGLNWYDYGTRHYDAALGRFTTVDPISEKYYGISPYAYCVNNPVVYIDPDGKKVYYATGVSNEFKNDFRQAVQYLNKYGMWAVCWQNSF